MDRDNFVLSVVIPCYNEKNHIREIVKKVIESQIKNKEIIIVDDLSTDGTRDILKNEIEPYVSKVIYHNKNQGKGGALRTGFKYASGDVVIIQDADMEYNPDDISKVVLPIIDGKCKVCYGSRFLSSPAKGYVANQLANKWLTLLSNFFTHQGLTDMETCYKAFSTDVIQTIEICENRFGFEPEITAKVSNLNIKIMEVPISYNPRTIKEGKKIGVKDGIRAIYGILKYSGRIN